MIGETTPAHVTGAPAFDSPQWSLPVIGGTTVSTIIGAIPRMGSRNGARR